jgi:hypothetical protein
MLTDGIRRLVADVTYRPDTGPQIASTPAPFDVERFAKAVERAPVLLRCPDEVVVGQLGEGATGVFADRHSPTREVVDARRSDPSHAESLREAHCPAWSTRNRGGAMMMKTTTRMSIERKKTSWRRRRIE